VIKQDVTLFTAVDRSGDPGFFARFLDEGNALPAIRTGKAIIEEALRLGPGAHVLDAGCGTGADAIELARRVGPHGRAVGVDLSDALIAAARERAAPPKLPVEFEVGDVQRLRFADETFDACRSERLLMHVPDARAAFAELVRVTRPGGRIVVFDFDWDTAIVDSAHRDTTRRIMRGFADAIRNGWIGRELPRLFAQHHLTDVTVTPHTVLFHFEFAQLLWGGHLTRAQQAGAVSPAAVERWWTDLSRANERGRFFAGLTAFIVAGTRT
jgi:ubiquinone/menaquinone biosynthesis C-methylase UbiE